MINPLPLVTIVIPCFNAENYILKLLENVKNQTYKNIECIIINDGSTDKSKDIIELFISSNNTSSFKIINQLNKGLSISRNIGIEQSKGDYIFFIDADDYIPEDSIENLIKLAQSEIDIIIGKTQITDITNGSCLGHLAHNINSNEVFQNNNAIFLKKIIENGLSCIAMNKLFKKKFIQENNLFFEEHLLHEDELWFFETIYFAKKIIITDKTTYYYHTNNSNSITNNRTKKNVFDTLRILDILYNKYYLTCNNEEEKEIIACYINHLKYIIIGSLNLLKKEEKILIQKKVYKHINKIQVTRNKIYLKSDLEEFYFHLFLMSFWGDNLLNFYLKNREKKSKKIKVYLKISLYLNYLKYRKHYQICHLK